MSAPDIRKAVRLTPGPLPVNVAKSEADRCEALLAQAQRNGAADMSYRELREEYARVYGVEIFPHTVQARLNALEHAGRVVCDRENRRKCRITGVLVQVYSVPLKQVELI